MQVVLIWQEVFRYKNMVKKVRLGSEEVEVATLLASTFNLLNHRSVCLSICCQLQLQDYVKEYVLENSRLCMSEPISLVCCQACLSPSNDAFLPCFRLNTVKYETALASIVVLDVLQSVEETGNDFAPNGILARAIRQSMSLTSLNGLCLRGNQQELAVVLSRLEQNVVPGELIGLEWSFVMAQIEKSAWSSLDLSGCSLIGSILGLVLAFPLPLNVSSLNLRQGHKLQSLFLPPCNLRRIYKAVAISCKLMELVHFLRHGIILPS